MAEASARRRGRGGGGAARRAERTAVRIDTAKYIERNIPNFEVLNEEALEIIEHNAETVLEEIGVNFVDNPAALERWRDAGADIDGERVRIPRGLARELIKTAPSQFTQHARNPEKSVEIGGRNLVRAPVDGPPFVRDAQGGRRYARGLSYFYFTPRARNKLYTETFKRLTADFDPEEAVIRWHNEEGLKETLDFKLCL